MREKNGKNAMLALLLFLVCFLAAVVVFRIHFPVIETDSASPTDASASQEIETAETPYDAELEMTKETEEGAAKNEEKHEPKPLREISLSSRDLDPALFEEASEQGTVSVAEYLTRDYYCDEYFDIRKQMAVYLPYNYDENEKYDVLILLHCGWADYRFWLINEKDYRSPEGESRKIYVKNLLDNMIEKGFCRPVIVLSPCCYLYDNTPNANGNRFEYEQLKREIGEDMLRFSAENYATWAKNGSRESLTEAREHIGFFGASYGAYVNYISIIGPNFDLAANFAFTGGGAIDRSYLMNSWAENGTDSLPLNCLYIVEGEYDDRAAPEASYESLLESGEPFSDDNLRYTMVSGSGHEDHTYLVALYNTLQLFFRE